MTDADQRLVLAQTPYVRALARRHARGGADVEDLVQSGLAALCGLVGTFNAADHPGVTLAQYARREILRSFRAESRANDAETIGHFELLQVKDPIDDDFSDCEFWEEYSRVGQSLSHRDRQIVAEYLGIAGLRGDLAHPASIRAISVKYAIPYLQIRKILRHALSRLTPDRG